MNSRLQPVQAQAIGAEMAFSWSDRSETYLPLEFLRRTCPCAACGGEPDVLGHIVRPEVTYTPESFLLKGWQWIGGYAWQPFWQDGHGSGLYSFPLLQRLGAAAAQPAASTP